jgi:hypothetical protein
LEKIAENWRKSPKIGENRRKLEKTAENRRTSTIAIIVCTHSLSVFPRIGIGDSTLKRAYLIFQKMLFLGFQNVTWIKCPTNQLLTYNRSNKRDTIRVARFF